LQKFIANKSPRKKKAIKNDYLDFERRKGKVEAELENLLPDHEQRAALKASVRDAQNKAKTGRFKEAYQDLKQVKRDARAAVRAYVRTVSRDEVEANIRHLDRQGDALQGEIDAILGGMRAVNEELRGQRLASSFRTAQEAFAYLHKESFGAVEENLRG